jgi:hypothetical protein
VASTLIYTKLVAFNSGCTEHVNFFSSMQVLWQPTVSLSVNANGCRSIPNASFLHVSSSFPGHRMQLPGTYCCSLSTVSREVPCSPTFKTTQTLDWLRVWQGEAIPSYTPAGHVAQTIAKRTRDGVPTGSGFFSNGEDEAFLFESYFHSLR